MFRVIFIGGFDMNGNEQEVTTVSNQVHSASRMKDTVSLVIFGLLPFNLIKYGATSVVKFIIYKRLSGVIRGIINR